MEITLGTYTKFTSTGIIGPLYPLSYGSHSEQVGVSYSQCFLKGH